MLTLTSFIASALATATATTMAIPSDFPAPVKASYLTDMDDKNSPFLYDAVYSKKADPPSLRDGEFIAQNTDSAVQLKALKQYMAEKCPDNTFSMTHFNNWGTTIYRLLLHVKPTSREEIVKIIQAAKDYPEDVKVFTIWFFRLSCFCD